MNRVQKILLVLISSFTLVSCVRNLGYGVILWSPDEMVVPTGSIVKVKSKIERKNVYQLELGQNNLYEIEQWRLSLFSNNGSAKNYAVNYAPYLRKYVELYQWRSLPMRSSANAGAEIIYNIAEGQTLKVLERSKERVEIPPLKGYWYKLLSSDGVVGYAFGRYLREYILSDNGTVFYDDTEDYKGDATLENFFRADRVWRPQYFKTMIDSNHINTDVFNNSYGLFIDPVHKTISVVLPDKRVNYSYNSILPTGDNNYYFDGSEVSFAVKPNEVTVRYVYNQQKFQENFVALPTDISVYINDEMSRRTEKYRTLARLGPSFKSDWGSLSFDGNGRFSLIEGRGFVERYYLRNTSGMGEVNFNIALLGGLTTNYTGAFTLNFDNGEQLFMVYRLNSAGFEAKLLDDLPRNRLLNDSNSDKIRAAPSLMFLK